MTWNRFEIIEGHLFMSGDYEEATDHVEHEVARKILHHFFNKLGYTSKYIHGYIDLLLSPREIQVDPRNHNTWVVSKRGCLMGEPGSKVVLTILTKCVDCSTREVYKTAKEL